MPSGKVKRSVRVSPLFGLPPDISTDSEAGEPLGPVTVALVRLELTEASLRPNVPASSSIATELAVGALIVRRPRPLAPRSAWLRSEMSCFSPAFTPSPLRMWSSVSTAGWSVARPENR